MKNFLIYGAIFGLCLIIGGSFDTPFDLPYEH